MNTKDFTEKAVEKTLTDYLYQQVQTDKDSITLPENLIEAMKNLSNIRTNELNPSKFDALELPALISVQNELLQNKYYIARELAVLIGAQSYAYIFRKFHSASQWSPVKDRLAAGRDKAPTVGEIESEVEKDLVQIRKTEVAYQVACDRIKVLLEWVDDAILNVQNRIRNKENDRRTAYADDQRITKQ